MKRVLLPDKERLHSTEVLVDSVDGDSVHLRNLLGEPHFLVLPKYMVPAAKRVGADLLEFVSPENADVVSGRKYFERETKGAKNSAEPVG